MMSLLLELPRNKERFEWTKLKANELSDGAGAVARESGGQACAGLAHRLRAGACVRGGVCRSQAGEILGLNCHLAGTVRNARVSDAWSVEMSMLQEGLRVGCENSGGIFDKYNGSE
jgi:hypothetical protein